MKQNERLNGKNASSPGVSVSATIPPRLSTSRNATSGEVRSAPASGRQATRLAETASASAGQNHGVELRNAPIIGPPTGWFVAA